MATDELAGAAAHRTAARDPGETPDRSLPVAAVVVETPLAHLDRVFEYTVAEELSADAVPGARVRVRFAGRDLEGFVLERRAQPEHDGRLSPLRRVVSPEPVLTPEVRTLARVVADRYAGTLSDVLRLAVPKRHAAAERNLPLHPPTPLTGPPPATSSTASDDRDDADGAESADAAAGVDGDGSADRADSAGRAESSAAFQAAPEPGPWAAYPAGPAWLRRVRDGGSPGAAWSALPTRRRDDDWPRAFAVAAAAALAGGRGSLLVVPDHRDVARLDRELTEVLGAGRHVRLTADQGPQARYTAWLKVLRGHVRVVIGTRAAAFAPVHDLGLVAWWDDGDDLLAEPRAPYHQTGVVLALRAGQSGAALLSGGFVRSLRTQVEVEAGRLVAVAAEPSVVRAAAPVVTVAGEGLDEERDGPAARAHLPSRAWRVAKDALVEGPVLVQVPRRGYLPSLSCAQCRSAVRCSRCAGPMALGSSGASPACRWCGTTMASSGFECAHCGARRWRSAVTGARRTAEEIGRAFPGVPVIASGSGEVLAQVGPEPAIVIATPGAEPVAKGGYTAVLLLDAWASLDLPVLDASLESLRRWTAAAALTRPGRAVVLCGVPEVVALPAVEALVRWDPAWLAERELADRRELDLPPAARFAQLTGPRRALDDALTHLDLPTGASVLGPMPVTVSKAGQAGQASQASHSDRRADSGPDWHVFIRIASDRTLELTRALSSLRAVRSARKANEVVTVRVDPHENW